MKSVFRLLSFTGLIFLSFLIAGQLETAVVKAVPPPCVDAPLLCSPLSCDGGGRPCAIVMCGENGTYVLCETQGIA